MSQRRARIAVALDIIASAVPAFERAAILDHAVDSKGLSTASDQAAAWAALVSYIRHTQTDYDDLRDDGYDEDSARFFVADKIDAVLAQWGCRRRVSHPPGD